MPGKTVSIDLTGKIFYSLKGDTIRTSKGHADLQLPALSMIRGGVTMPFWEIPPQRPPSEAYSLLIRATRNCPWSRCEFCGSYRGSKFEIRTPEEVKQDITAVKATVEEIRGWAKSIGCSDQIDRVARANGILWLDGGEVRNVFIGDADSAIMKTHDFAEIDPSSMKLFLISSGLPPMPGQRPSSGNALRN